jgi:Tol biopolymer transport system component
LVLDRIESSNGWPFVSSDERWLVRVNNRKLESMPMSGGAWSPVASGSGDQFAITPDGAWIYFDAKDPAGTHGLFRVATAGGTPERVGDFPVQGGSGTLRISPDGRKIVAALYDPSNSFETWSLENFVPAEPKR